MDETNKKTKQQTSKTKANVRKVQNKNTKVVFHLSGRSDQSVLKWNVRVLRTGSGHNGPAHGSQPLSSPAPVDQSAGNWRVVVSKMYAHALDFAI